MSFFNRADREPAPAWHVYYTQEFIDNTYKTPSYRPSISPPEALPESVPAAIFNFDGQTSLSHSATQSSEASLLKHRSVEFIEDNSWKRQKLHNKVEPVELGEIPLSSKTGIWTAFEICTLLNSVQMYKTSEGVDYEKVARIVGTHNPSECGEKHIAIRLEKMKRDHYAKGISYPISAKPLSEKKVKMAKDLYGLNVPLDLIAAILKRSYKACEEAVKKENDVPPPAAQTKFSPSFLYMFGPNHKPIPMPKAPPPPPQAILPSDKGVRHIGVKFVNPDAENSVNGRGLEAPGSFKS